MPPLTLEEMDRIYGVQKPNAPAAPTMQKTPLTVAEMDRIYGVTTAKQDEEKQDEESFIKKMVRQGLENTTPGLLAQISDGKPAEQEDLGLVGGIGQEIISFVADPVTYATGGLGNVAARMSAKAVAGQTAKKIVGGAVHAGVQLGGLEAAKDPLRQTVETGTVDPAQTLANVGKATASGLAFGPAAAVRNSALRAGAEVASMAATPIITEGRLPTKDDWIHAAGTVGGFKIVGAIQRALARVKPGDDPRPEIVKEIGAENVQKIDEEMARMRANPPVVDDATRNLAALAEKETVSRKEYMAATGAKNNEVPVAAERKAAAEAAAERVKQEKSDAVSQAEVVEEGQVGRVGSEGEAGEVQAQAQEAAPVNDVLAAPVPAPLPGDSVPVTPQEGRGAKQPWEMTRQEHVKANLFGLGHQRRTNVTILKAMHRKAVTEAVEQGKPVPQEVLADYPDIAANVTPAAEQAAQAAEPTRLGKAAEAHRAKAKELFDELEGRGQQLGSTGGGVDPKAVAIWLKATSHEIRAAGLSFADYVTRVVQKFGKDAATAFKNLIRDTWEAERLKNPKMEAAGDIDAIIAKVEAPRVPRETARPDLAVPVQGQAAQEALNIADTIRTAAGEPARISYEQADALANQRIATEGPELVRRLVAGEWGPPETSPDTFTQIKVLNALGKEQGLSEDLIRATLNYRQGGTQAAQAFEARKTAVANTMTMPEQQAFFNREAMVTPPPKIEKLILKLQAEEAEAARRGETTARGKKTAEQVTKEWHEKVRSIEGKLKAMGHDVERAIAGGLDPIAQREFTRDVHALKATTPDKLYEWWSNSILSGPATQIVNATGNVAHSGWYFTAERITDALLNSMARGLGFKTDGATFGELKYAYRAMVENFGKSAKNFFETWHSEQPTFYKQHGLEIETAYGYRPGAIAGKTGKAIRTPWRLLAAVDDFVKWQTYEMERSALAYRSAKNEGLQGESLTKRMRELLDDPVSTTNKRAVDTAIKLAFQESTKFAKGTSQVVHNIPGGRYVLPFITTPFNIVKTGIRKSPFGSLKLAQEVVKASQSGDWSHISPRVAEQVLAWGATLALAYSNDPADPWITGGDDPNRKYAVKIGGQWYNYGRVEPFATTLGLMVDAVNNIHKGKDLFESVKAPFDALIGRIDDQTFFTGLSDFMKAARYQDSQYVLEWASKFPSSWVPNLVRAPLRNTADDVPQRRVWGKGAERADRMLDRGLKSFEVMPDVPKYDLWGRTVPKDGSPIPHTDWIWRTLSPVGTKKYQETIGDRMLLRWNAANPHEPMELRPPNPYFMEDGKTYYFTDEEYAQYVRESGKLTHERLTALQAGGGVNMNNPTERDMKRLKKIIESSRDRIRNAIKRARKKRERATQS